MRKRVAIPTRPAGERARAAELWVRQAEVPGRGAGGTQIQPPTQPPAQAMRRLTLDLPEELHRRIKVDCAARGVKMADALRALLAAHYPPDPRDPDQ